MTDLHELRVIAVDDDAMWRELVDDELSDIDGINYEVVGTADEAIERLETGDFDGVVTDGLEGQWRRVAEAAKLVGAGVILLSADTDQVELARAEGMGGIVKMTFDYETFGALVSAFGTEEV